MTNRFNFLVVGGAGYIGSHMTKFLIERGNHVCVFDNLSTGYRDAVFDAEFFAGDLSSVDEIQEVLRLYCFDGVFHFASNIEVAESVVNPHKYYFNNVRNTLNLIDAMIKVGSHRLIFSSTAAVYGHPEKSPMTEDHPRNPINPYGRSKQMIETILSDYRRAHGFKSMSLRYFNAAGADPGGRLGERHDPESHLIPIAIQAALGQRDSMSVFGADYETPDGSCVRDYIHVNDLCDAHLRAFEYLNHGSFGTELNLGTGQGFSVFEVIDAVKRASKRDFPVLISGRRLGDPAELVADAGAAYDTLGWSPSRSNLDQIVKDAWNFYVTRNALN
ncbi:UDP-glucose 4-epimerase GalE [Litorivicinus sp.]|nr:UDP-glucose 4-epimerase GalE [Litorivicinus sp.]